MITIARLHKEDGGKCYYCNCETIVPEYRGKNKNRQIINHPKNASREHLVPQCEGGTDDRINIKLACSECNTLRGNMYAVTWKIIANNPRTRRGYIKMRNNQKFLKKGEKMRAQQERRAAEVYEYAIGVIVRHHTWGIKYFKEVFGEQYV